MQAFINYLDNNIEDAGFFAYKIGLTVAGILILWVAQRIISYGINKYAEKESTVRRVKSLTATLATFMGIVLVFWIWFASFRGVGIIFAGILFLLFLSLQDIIMDITYFVYVKIKRPFKIGDVVEMKGTVGIIDGIDGIQIRLRELGNIVHNLELTGRMVTVPNRTLFEEKVYNYTYDETFLVQDISILIGFEEDRDLAIRVAGKVAYEHFDMVFSKNEGEELERFERELEDNKSSLSPRVWAEYDPNGFQIFVRYFTKIDNLAINRRILESKIYDEFVKNDIKMPTPTYIRIHGQDLEG